MTPSEEDTRTLPPPPPSKGQTAGTDKDDRPKIRISSTGSLSAAHRDGLGMSISGMDSQELQQLEGALHGHNWITVNGKGRLRVIPTYKPLPDPIEDKLLDQFWRPAIEGVEAQLELFSMEPLPDYSSPSLIIRSLCGYNYSAERYVYEAKRLMSWGFECLRSRRNEGGNFYEVWMLSSLYSAKQELKEAIKAAQPKGYTSFSGQWALEAAVSFLCRHAQFGTLDACNQRAAMTID
ncbi:MAG: hypothetical protein JWL87_411 [Candidatus Adlerbacteria bacterium]|nr:hypothetical protein [Candidatus Adlerbacteria bacterium]